ncbi:MAG: hypothetical protein LUI10_05950 [Lachnospiraceae bacterium]|nr:hypothetical protein [Lachnospiraceae bacterium]
MLIKEKDFDEKNTVMKEGILKGKTINLKYRLTEPVWLALMGETNQLQKLIEEGMPASGFDRSLGEKLLREEYLTDGKRDADRTDRTIYLEWEMGAQAPEAVRKLWGKPAFLRHKFYFTTVDAALAAGRAETFQMLVRHGARFSLDNIGQQELLFCCEDEETLACVIEEWNQDLEFLDYDHLFGEYGWNLTLIRALLEAGIRPEKVVLDKMAARGTIQEMEVGGIILDPIALNNRRYRKNMAALLETPTGQFLQQAGYRQIHENLEEWREELQDELPMV